MQFLASKGFEILDTNWRFQRAEIDIVARHGDLLVMVEVKARSSNYYGEPEQFVDDNKRGHLLRAAEGYLEQSSLDCEIRFDVVSVLFNKEVPTITHIEDAFGA